jgi:antitoxin component YwqK of YwqJK toxin-antitoxin module/Flp pilus assembly protein TadD
MALTMFANTSLFSQITHPFYFNSADSLQKAVAFYEKESYDSAIAIIDKFHPGDTNITTLLEMKGRALFVEDKYEDALAVAQYGLELKRGNEPFFTNLLASAYSEIDSSKAAIAAYNDGIKKYPSDYALRYSLGKTYYDLGEKEKAQKYFHKVVELNPYHFYSHYFLATMAFNNEQFAQAYLSLGYCVLISPESSDLNNLLVLFNEQATEDVVFEPNDANYENDKFRKINLLISSDVALREDYEVDGKIDFPLIKQMHLAYEQAAKLKAKNGFLVNYYLPFYRALMEEELFEEFVLMAVKSSGSEYHQKMVAESDKDIKEFVSWAASRLKAIHNEHHIDYDPKKGKINYFYHGGSNKLSAVGRVESERATGPFSFYYPSGALKSKGTFERGSKEGPWVYYHENGTKNRESVYEDDLIKGLSTEYYENGYKSFEGTYSKGDFNGVVKVYNENGALQRKMIIRDEATQDTTIYFYPNGEISAKVPVIDGLTSGLAEYYHETGEKASLIKYANDKREGKSYFYHGNGQLKSDPTYSENYFDGPYISYHQNGAIKDSGAYSEGTKTGAWKSYNPFGILITEESYDERGKFTGVRISYDNSGRKESEFTYNKGDISAYKLYNLAGEVISEGEKKWGKFKFENYNLHGVKIADGFYHGDHKEGRWTFYDNYGNKLSEEEYNEDGELIGTDKTYYSTGQLKSEFNYTNGEQDGYYAEYYLNGKKSEEGWHTLGKQQGFERSYYSNGQLQSESFYVNGLINGPLKSYHQNGELYMVKHFYEGNLFKTESIFNNKVNFVSTNTEVIARDERQYPNGTLAYRIQTAGKMFNDTTFYFYGNGQISTKGHYVNGYKQGLWLSYYPSGQLKKSTQYDLGDIIEEQKFYHRNGKLESVYNHFYGEVHGPNEDYYSNGELKEKATYYLGQYHSKRLFYTRDGKLNHVRIYDHGIIVGYIAKPNAQGEGTVTPIKNGTGNIKSYYTNGKLARSFQLKNGDFTGDYFIYYDNGQVALKETFVDDAAEGVYKTFYPNGNPLSTSNYEKGVLVGSKVIYHSNGKKKFEGSYLSGSLQGNVFYYGENGTATESYNYLGGELYDTL